MPDGAAPGTEDDWKARNVPRISKVDFAIFAGSGAAVELTATGRHMARNFPRISPTSH